jgi:hypothetical protein
MRNNLELKKSNFWFTLVEVIVAVTIMSIIMISVMFIFVNSTQLSMKIDINRVLQENSKNIIETISEDLRKNDIRTCSDWIIKWCLGDNTIMTWSELWIWNNHYYVAKKNDTLWEYIKVDNLPECTQIQCFILKNWQILSNSFVTIYNLEFTIINEHIPKIQINILIKPTLWKWVNTNLIKNSELNLQTTLSEEYIKN